MPECQTLWMARVELCVQLVMSALLGVDILYLVLQAVTNLTQGCLVLIHVWSALQGNSVKEKPYSQYQVRANMSHCPV